MHKALKYECIHYSNQCRYFKSEQVELHSPKENYF